jgi:uncharacterized protein
MKKLFVLFAIFLTSLGAHATAADDYFAAVQQDDESTVVALTLRGFDLNTLNAKGDSALLIALKLGSTKVADFLLKQNAVKVEARNRQGESPLMMAALKARLPQAKRLIQREAEVNKPGWTPLHYAASNPEPVSAEMVSLLLENHAYIDAASPNKTTPLMMAAHYGHDSVVKLLLEEGADPMLRNDQGLSAIDFAHRAKRTEAAAMIAAQIRSKQPGGRW